MKKQIQRNSREITDINTDYFFKYYGGSYFSLDNGDVIMTSPYVDNSGGRYSTSTGKFTIPVSGRYRFEIYFGGMFYTCHFQGRLLADGKQVEYFQYNNEGYNSSHRDDGWFSFERKFTAGQKVNFHVDYRYKDTLSSSTSFIQGQLIRKD